MLSNHPNCLGGNGPSASSDLIGDVDGPASATDNAVARFDGTTGKLIQNSVVTIADSTGAIAGASSLTSPASTNLTLAGGAGNQSIILQPSGNATVEVKSGSAGNWALLATIPADGTGASVYSATPAGTVTASNPNWYVGHRFSAHGNFAIWPYNGSSHVANYLTIAASTGNVGIGTTSPEARLQVSGSTFPVSRILADFKDTTATAQNDGGGISFSGNYNPGSGDSRAYWGYILGQKESATASNYAGYLSFYTAKQGVGAGPDEKMRIDSNGNLLIGTTDATGLTGAGGLKINSSTAGSAGAGALVVTGGLSTGAASYFGGAVNVAGAVTANVTSSNYISIVSNATNKDAAFKSGDGTNNWYAGLVGGSFGTDGAYRILEQGFGTARVTIAPTTGNTTFVGTVIAPAATASLAPLRIPHGTAPTSPTNGDMWTTTAGLYIRINGATVGPLS